MTRRGFSKRDVERVKDMRIDGRALLKMELKSLIDSSHVNELDDKVWLLFCSFWIILYIWDDYVKWRK